MKHILLIGTGGTIACKATENGLAPALTSGELLDYVSESREFCRVDTLQIANIDSTDVTPRDWSRMSHAVEDHYDDYDGFVICHGTDTLAYTASALSYMIQNSRKPVVLTGAQMPINAPDTDARVNLLDSLRYAADPLSQGVSIVFGGHVIAGTRARKERAKSYNAFSSINFPDLAVIRAGRILRFIPPSPYEEDVRFYHDMDASVCVLKLIPGISSDLLRAVFERFDCVILESFGVGGLPTYLMEEFSRQMKQRRTFVVMATQVLYEGSDMNVYEVGRRVKKDFDLPETYDMTIEAAVTKAAWLLGRTDLARKDLAEEFRKPVAYDHLI